MKKHLYTNTELFKLIMNQLQSENRVPDILDYALAESEATEIRNYEFDVLGAVNYGGSEGVYIDLFLRGNIGYGWSKECTKLGTIKTLRADDDAFRQMAVLMADFQIAATRFVNAHLDDFTWLGYDIDYYLAGAAVRSYGVTMKGVKSFDEATEEAKRHMKRFTQYVKAVITRNSDEKTKTIYGNEDQMRYFEVRLEEFPESPNIGFYDFDMCIRGIREPSIEEAEAFTQKDREQFSGHVLHVTRVEEISYRDAVREFDLSLADSWPVFGLDRGICKHCVNGDCEMSCEEAPCSGSQNEQAECAYC